MTDKPGELEDAGAFGHEHFWVWRRAKWREGTEPAKSSRAFRLGPQLALEWARLWLQTKGTTFSSSLYFF